MSTPADRGGPTIDAVATLAQLDGHLLRILAGGRRAGAPIPSRAARLRKDRYRRFLDALGVALYTTDANGRITFFNEAAVELWGRRPKLGELWCGSLRIFSLDGSPLPHDRCPMAIALRENRAVRGIEAIVERPDGSRVWFLPFPTPLRDDAGALIGAVNVMVDVTERRHTEEALRRTAAALESSNAVQDEFLGLVSHELRTPVTTIFGNARLLHDRGDHFAEDVRAGMIADILKDSERLHAIIENLLQLNRLAAGQQPELEPQVIDLVVRRAIHAFRRRRPDREVLFADTRSGQIVEADATWLELLVDNLLSNADKYSPRSESIEVVLSPRDEAVEVAVLDRGMGFEGNPEELFQPFFRTAAAKQSADGIGIGLTVCRRIVEVLGGRIAASRRAGGGTQVSFALPVVQADALS